MENATKALLIGGAFLIAMAVLSLLVIFWNDISIYFTANYEEKMLQQLIEFNNKFANYAGKEIRGNELVSIMNRIVDYNNYQSDMIGYEPIKIRIIMPGDNWEFRHGTETPGTGNIINKNGNISNFDASGNIDDEQIRILATTSSRLVSEYTGNPPKIRGLTDTKLQKMSAGIDTIVFDDSAQYSTYSIEIQDELEFNRDRFLTKTLGYDVNDSTKVSDKEQLIEDVKKVTYQYYQYTMFKRAMFECTEVSYNDSNGRINEMKFEVIKQSNGNVKFD